MKYTMSKDGVKRANFWTSVRLTRAEYAHFSTLARELGYDSLQAYMSEKVANGVWTELEEEYEKRDASGVL